MNSKCILLHTFAEAPKPFNRSFCVVPKSTVSAQVESSQRFSVSSEVFCRMQAHLHHYTTVDGMELDQLTQSMESLNSLVCEYESLETTMGVPTVHRPRFKLA
jgi:hypothetical protein